ncbi:hypothetical protein [Galbibacter sp. BG1]
MGKSVKNSISENIRITKIFETVGGVQVKITVSGSEHNINSVMEEVNKMANKVSGIH